MSPAVNPVKSDPKLPEAADVVVIGGGIIGCGAAYFLARRNVRVAILEKGRIGAEQSSRNWGWCRQQGRDPAEIPLIKESLSLWGTLDVQVGADLGFRRTGVLQVSTNKADLDKWQDWIEQAREYQIQSRILTTREVEALVPGARTHWIGGLHTPSDGRAEPAMATPAFAQGAQRLSATVHQNCAARGLEFESGRIASVVTEYGPIRTRTVLCAGGAWSSLFCRRHGIDLPQLPVRASVLRTTPAPAITDGAMTAPGFSLRRRLDGGYTLALRGRIIFDIIPDAFRYMRRFWAVFRQEGRNLKLRLGQPFFDALASSGHWALDQCSPFERVRVWDPKPDAIALKMALANLKATYPVLRDVEVAERWAGMIDATPDAVPVISPVAAFPGFYIATGFSGHGFGIGPGAGHLAADLITGDRPIVDPHPFRYARMIDGTRLVPNVGL